MVIKKNKTHNVNKLKIIGIIMHYTELFYIENTIPPFSDR